MPTDAEAPHLSSIVEAGAKKRFWTGQNFDLVLCAARRVARLPEGNHALGVQENHMTESKPTELWDYPEFRGCRPLATEIGMREGLDAALVFQTVFMVCLTMHSQMRKSGHPDEDILDDFPTGMVREVLLARRDNPAEYFGDGMIGMMDARLREKPEGMMELFRGVGITSMPTIKSKPGPLH